MPIRLYTIPGSSQPALAELDNCSIILEILTLTHYRGKKSAGSNQTGKSSDAVAIQAWAGGPERGTEKQVALKMEQSSGWGQCLDTKRFVFKLVSCVSHPHISLQTT